MKGTYAKILVDEFDFSGETSGLSVDITMGEEECTNLESEEKEFEAILPAVKISQNGYLTGLDTDGFEAELIARNGITGAIIAALVGTNVSACPVYVLERSYGSNMTVNSPSSGLMTLSGDWGLGRGGDRGIRIFTGLLEATGTQTSVDLGDAGTDGGAVYFFVQAIDGTATDAIISVESSATEGGTYAEEASLTLSAVGGYREAMTGTVNQWVRVNLEDLGGADGITFVVVVCVKGVTE